MSDFQTWYSDPANRQWYWRQQGKPDPGPAPRNDFVNDRPSTTTAVDWDALRRLTEAGLSSDDIRTLGSRSGSVTGPALTPEPATRPGPAPAPANGGSGGSGTSNSGQPTGMGSARLVRDNMGVLWVVNFGATGGVRQRVDPTQAQDAIDLYGQPITSVDQLPSSVRDAQLARFGTAGGGAIALDVRLGFQDAGTWDRDAAQSEDDQERSDNRSAHALIREVLDRYGLGELSQWAWQQLVNGRSHAEVMLELREQPTFKERFKAIDIRRQHGLNPVSPEDIINYETTARDLMRASGLPRGFYDEADDFAELIGKGVSLQSVQHRVRESWDRVVNAPEEVRGAMFELYGMQSDQALAALFFDPDKAETKLADMARTAVAGGAMDSFGFDIDATAAGRVAGFDLADSAVRSGFGRLAQLRSVFNETRGERNQADLDAMTEGVNAVFDAGEGAEAIESRIGARRAEFGGGGGGYLSQRGLTGAGTV